MWKKWWSFVESTTSEIYTCAVIRHPAGAGQDALNPRRFRLQMSGRY